MMPTVLALFLCRENKCFDHLNFLKIPCQCIETKEEKTAAWTLTMHQNKSMKKQNQIPDLQSMTQKSKMWQKKHAKKRNEHKWNNMQEKPQPTFQQCQNKQRIRLRMFCFCIKHKKKEKTDSPQKIQFDQCCHVQQSHCMLISFQDKK